MREPYVWIDYVWIIRANHLWLICLCELYMWIVYVRIGCVWIICANHLWLICSCKLYVWIVYVRIGCVWIICVLCVNFMCESYVWSDSFFWHYVNHMREMMTPYQIVLNVEQCVAVCCSVLQCVAVCCSVLQCVAVCCSVFNIWLFWKLSSHVSEKVFSCVVTNSLMDCTLETPMKSVKYYWNLWNMNTIWMESVKCSWNLWNTNEICEMLMKSVYATTFWTPTACWTTSSWMAIDKNNSRLLLLAWHHVTRINDVEMIISTEIVQHDVTSHISMMLQWLFRQKLYYMTSRHIYQWRHVTYMMLKKCCMLNNI